MSFHFGVISLEYPQALSSSI